ncbi:MAG TPA: carbohydrate kinase family protein [Afifellaceae bacterium]|nr:carbohydrate kinase family protein [Afifellaceae bacterium]
MSDPGTVICIGGAAIDRKYRALRPVASGTSNPVHGARSHGGVARNVAENLARLGIEAELITSIGRDDTGRDLTEHLSTAGVGVDLVIAVEGGRTAEYCAVLEPDGALAVAVADMAIFDRLTPGQLEPFASRLKSAAWLFADCNLPAETIRYLLEIARISSCRLAVDAVSVAKSARLPDDLSGINVLFLNGDEATAILGGETELPDDAAGALRLRGAEQVVLTLGPEGCLAAGPDGFVRLPAVVAEIVDVTGAGDAMVAATLARLVAGASWKDAVEAGTRAAAATASSKESVIPATFRF